MFARCGSRLRSHIFELNYLNYFRQKNHLSKPSNSQRSCIAIITNHFKKRLENTNYFNIDTSAFLIKQHLQENQLVHHIILRADPDQFEKLPPKCASCGVILQTSYKNTIGFIPKAKFLDSIQEGTVKNLVCYECFRLRHHNEGQVVPRLQNFEICDQLKHLRRRKALVLYTLDIFDIEGTLVPNLLQLIGKRKRLIIVGNKIDRIPRDSKKPLEQLEHMKDVLKNICFENGIEESNFRDICLVSAKTGYGLQPLIQKINKHRDVNMDVYIVGCANTGKSTLYNLIVNLLNVHKSCDLPNQAIEHHAPGSTLSLVREDISMRRLQRMAWRLNQDPWEEERGFVVDEEVLDMLQVKEPKIEKKPKQLSDRNKALDLKKLEFVGDDYLKGKFEKQNYIYDTPGIFNESQLILLRGFDKEHGKDVPQIIRYLKSSEINYLSPRDWIVPRTVILKPGQCVFMGGLARVDYEDIWRPKIDNVEEKSELSQSAQSIYVTAMMSPNVPLHVTVANPTSEKYERLFINNILKIPEGSEQRFSEYPPLSSSEYTVIGKNLNINACDIVLHGVGWFSVAATLESRVQLKVYTPNGIGQQLRRDPLLPYTVRGKSGRGKNYLGRTDSRLYGHARKNSPSFVRVFQQQNEPVYAWRKKIHQKMKVERLQKKENIRLKRIQDGIVLGKWRALKEKEQKLNELLESSESQKAIS